ncbi:hypothetical protein BFS06_14550 [Clostridium perfringens]|uniref:Putative ligand binding protein n=1 Tax=Clostridium perfringens TaxID=1502 RepID=A0A140GR97_CLOPF|nr:hypothetical protein [Clostridium perfringens]AMN31056.1 putative ligand binding protein [Clostridium perfringens]TBX14425.1 hypothetical protein BFS06_14550 [Clostridium perfringens]
MGKNELIKNLKVSISFDKRKKSYLGYIGELDCFSYGSTVKEAYNNAIEVAKYLIDNLDRFANVGINILNK